jgi:hypothetical protein
MYGLTTSQSVEAVLLLVSIVMYFAGINSAQQNAWSYVFAVVLTCLIIGNCCGK